jgi:hypothetical protein
MLATLRASMADESGASWERILPQGRAVVEKWLDARDAVTGTLGRDDPDAVRAVFEAVARVLEAMPEAARLALSKDGHRPFTVAERWAASEAGRDLAFDLGRSQAEGGLLPEDEAAIASL